MRGPALAPTQERCPLADAVGRILAENIEAPIALPPWTYSAMDGYAVRRADVAWRFSAINEVVPRVPSAACDSGHGDGGHDRHHMPPEPMVSWDEETDGALEGEVTSAHPRWLASCPQRGGGDPARRARRRPRTGDSSGDVTLWSALGLADVSVMTRPKVAVLVTGDGCFAGSAIGAGPDLGRTSIRWRRIPLGACV